MKVIDLTPKADDAVVQLLENMLELAKAGEIQGVTVVTDRFGGTAHSAGIRTLGMVGGLTAATKHMLDKMY